MAYIGKPPSTKFSAAAKQDSFTGDGSTTTFDVANIIPAGGENSIQVFVDNVRQKPGSSNAYTIGNDGSGDLKRITFTAAPDASAEIYVITPFEATNIKNIGDGTVTTAKLDSTAVTTAKLGADAVTGAKLADDAVDSEHFVDGSVDNAHLAGSIADSKLSTITTASKVNVSALSAPGSASVFLRGDRTYGAIPTDQIDTNAFNISLLGFKMAVNEGLTVFNLVDGIVDEFHDESGTDEGEGSNDRYCASSDYYTNTAADTPYSAGFGSTSITEPGQSAAATNPGRGNGQAGQFTVPSGLTSLNIFAYGSGGGADRPSYPNSKGGGGGYAEGTFAVTPGQTLKVYVGEGGSSTQSTPSAPEIGERSSFGGDHPGDSGTTAGQRAGGGSARGGAGGGGGLSGVFTGLLDQEHACRAVVIAGSGGGGGADGNANGAEGGSGGGLTGAAGGQGTAQVSAVPIGGDNQSGGGDQEQGGEGAKGAPGDGGLFYGAAVCDSDGAGGGAGYYGGGSGRGGPGHNAGGGGSSYYGHPQVTSGATSLGTFSEGAVGEINATIKCQPNWPAVYNLGENPDGPEEVGIGGVPTQGSPAAGVENAGNGYVLLVGGATGSTTSTTIVSNAFTSTSVPTTSRIVVFEENIATPTLNTDIIASISRDGGSNFTTATLTDSGYVTGSSGQRILTGQATISGQPSGQSMRWKLALANNAVKIHGVSLQWS